MNKTLLFDASPSISAFVQLQIDQKELDKIKKELRERLAELRKILPDQEIAEIAASFDSKYMGFTPTDLRTMLHEALLQSVTSRPVSGHLQQILERLGMMRKGVLTMKGKDYLFELYR